METHTDTAGIADVPGFGTAATACDIRDRGDDRLDLALIHSPRPCHGAGVFTLNDVAAAPVQLCRKHLARRGPFHAIIANSGNANAATGPAGLVDATAMAQRTAAGLAVPDSAVFVCSTGRIGRRLPLKRIEAGIQRVADQLDSTPETSRRAASAILTSDTRAKTVTVRFPVGSSLVTVAGMAKGAGMIEPHMATMLAFLATDADVDGEFLQTVLSGANRESFNRITVDGDMSTNDTVLLLANGASGCPIAPGSEDANRFTEAVSAACLALARMIVGDGERISRVVRVEIRGAAHTEGAERVARAVANSLLVKTSWFGGDPNWGRVLDAAGYARVGLDPERVDIFYEDCPVLLSGTEQSANLPQWREIVARREFRLIIDLHQGDASTWVLSTDLTDGYVNFNKSE